jgi:hypothetical protein
MPGMLLRREAARGPEEEGQDSPTHRAQILYETGQPQGGWWCLNLC